MLEKLVSLNPKSVGASSLALLVVGVLVIGLLPATVEAGSPGGEPVLNPDNGHYYEWYNDGAGYGFLGAQALAESRQFNGVPGHLVTVTSAAEENFLAANFPLGTVRYWVGGTDEGSEGDWYWITGEPWGYENWGPGEPNGDATENCIEYQPVNVVQWNDLTCQAGIPDLLIEYPAAPVPAMPSAMLLGLMMVLLLGGWAVMRCRCTLDES